MTATKASDQSQSILPWLYKTGGVIGLRLIAIVVVFAMSIVVSRTLGSRGFGVYAVGSAWMISLASIGCLGLNTSTSRFIPSYIARKQWGELRSFIRESLGRIFIASFIASAGMMLFVRFDKDSADGESFATIAVFAIGVGLYAFTQFFDAALRAIGRSLTGMLSQSVIPTTILGGIGIATLLVPNIQPVHAAIIYCAALTASLVFFSSQFFRHLPTETRHATPVPERHAWNRSSAMNVVTNLSMVGYSHGMTILTGVYCGLEAAGLFAICLRLVNQCAIGTQAVAVVAVPKLAGLHATSETEKFTSLVSRSLIVSAVMTCLAAVLLWFLGETILGWYNESYTSGAGILAIMLIGIAAESFTAIAAYLLSATGHERDNVIGMSVRAIVGALVIIALAPSLGLKGVAFAYVAAVLAGNFTLVYSCYSRLSILPVAFLVRFMNANDEPPTDELKLAA